MKLKEVLIYKYKSIETTQKVTIDDKITVLVGMNESGKTTILEALAKTNYFSEDEKFKFNTTYDYPRREKKEMDKLGESPIAVRAKYFFTDNLLQKVEEDIGTDVLKKNYVEISTYYDNKTEYIVDLIDWEKFISYQLKQFNISDETIKEQLTSIQTYEEYKELVDKYIPEDIEDEDSKEEISKKSTDRDIKVNIHDCLKNLGLFLKKESSWGNNLETLVNEYIAETYVSKKLPKFLYYDEYYSLPSRVDITKLQNNTLENEELKTAKALFELAQIDVKELINSTDFEEYKAELEATEAIISDILFEYWTTNKNLEIVFDIDKVPNPDQRTIMKYFLDIRVRNTRAKMSLPLKNRSKGFNWFFSFLVWFKKIQEDRNSNYILLLDEPGLNLHASAQADLLRFIDDLSDEYQVIYTTHSPFMVKSDKLDAVRTVLETEKGSVISESIQEKDPNTLFPLQAALGYDIAQNLFISKNNLLVEGASDLIYLQTMSGLLEESGRIGLSEEITIVPVGGLDKVSVFISLLRGSKLNIICLLDSSIDTKNKQKINNLVTEKLIKQSKVLFFDEFIPNTQEADIEDIFSKNEYLELFNLAYETEGKSIDLDDLNEKIPRITLQIAKYLNQPRYNHYRPASALLKNPDMLSKIEKETLDRFENIFKKINNLVN